MLDRFIAAHAIDVAVAEDAMAMDPARHRAHAGRYLDPARATRVRIIGGLSPAAAARSRPAPQRGRDDDGAPEDARPPHARQPGPRHQPQGEPRAAGRRRGRGRGARLRRTRDHGRAWRAMRRSTRMADPDRFADRPRHRAHAMRGGGIARPAPGPAGPDHLRRNAFRVRHRAGLPRRRRHARGRKRSWPRPMRRAASRCASPPARARKR